MEASLGQRAISAARRSSVSVWQRAAGLALRCAPLQPRRRRANAGLGNAIAAPRHPASPSGRVPAARVAQRAQLRRMG